MGFKMKQGPISMKGSPVHLPGIGNALKAGYNAMFGSSTPKAANPKDPRNMTREQRNTIQKKGIRELHDLERKMTHEISSKGDYEVPALGSSGYGIKGSGYKDEATGGITTLIGPTTPKKRKKIKTLDTKITPKKTNTDTKIVNTKATAKTITKKETASKPGKLRSQKNIRNRKLSNKEGSMTRRERRLMKTLDKASSAKAKTNQTAKSIDTSKPKSADTGAKQISARSSRAKAKRLENRASRIEGRIERKASRQAQRKKIKENR
tara:strand:+ start:479 stop:1273 length:795 start_codon:yes stop_codon:yes gene_type:complete